MPITQLTDPNFRHTWHTRANDIIVTIKEKLLRQSVYRLLTNLSSWLCAAHVRAARARNGRPSESDEAPEDMIVDGGEET